MKPDIITISLIMISCVILPIFLLPVISYFNKRKLLQKFVLEAKKHKLTVEQKEFWNLSILGIDPVQKKLLFVQKRNDLFSVELVDLLTVKESKLIPVLIRSRKYRQKGSLLSRIDLQLTFVTNKSSKLLNLYDSRLNIYKELEFSHAEKWNCLIQKYLPVNHFLQKTA